MEEPAQFCGHCGLLGATAIGTKEYVCKGHDEAAAEAQAAAGTLMDPLHPIETLRPLSVDEHADLLQPEDDYWEVDHIEGKYVRVHEAPRTEAFVPGQEEGEEPGGPGLPQNLSTRRVTVMTFTDGTHDIHEDDWKKEGAWTWKDKRTWVGETWLYPIGFEPDPGVSRRRFRGKFPEDRAATRVEGAEELAKGYVVGKPELVAQFPPAKIEKSILEQRQRVCPDLASVYTVLLERTRGQRF
jgi:hypothetical protein